MELLFYHAFCEAFQFSNVHPLTASSGFQRPEYLPLPEQQVVTISLLSV